MICIEIIWNESSKLLLCSMGRLFGILSQSILARVQSNHHFLKPLSERLITVLEAIPVIK